MTSSFACSTGRWVVIEAKNAQSIVLPEFLRELLVERGTYNEPGLDPNKVAGVVVVKARGKSTAEAFVVPHLVDCFPEMWP